MSTQRSRHIYSYRWRAGRGDTQALIRFLKQSEISISLPRGPASLDPGPGGSWPEVCEALAAGLFPFLIN